MKIKTAKFFQHIEVPTGNHEKHEIATSVRDLHHDIELLGNLIKVTHRASGNFVYVTIFNTSFMRPADVQPDTKPAGSAKGADKKKTEKSPVVLD